jgi:hypothetical protein
LAAELHQGSVQPALARTAHHRQPCGVRTVAMQPPPGAARWATCTWVRACGWVAVSQAASVPPFTPTTIQVRSSLRHVHRRHDKPSTASYAKPECRALQAASLNPSLSCGWLSRPAGLCAFGHGRRRRGDEQDGTGAAARWPHVPVSTSPRRTGCVQQLSIHVCVAG